MTRLTQPVRLAFSDLLLLGLTRLRTRPLRAALSALGISIGIATMIVVTGIPASSQQAVLDELSTLGPNLLRAAAVPDASGQSDTAAGLPAEAVGMAGRIGPVRDASGVANVHASVRRSDKLDTTSSGSGITVLAGTPNLAELLGTTMYSGKFLSPATDKFPTVVLGAKAATWLGITSLPIGQPLPRILLNDTWFTVIGILAKSPLAPDLEQSVLVGWEAAKASLGFDGRPTVVYVRSADTAVEDVRAVLGRTLSPEQPGLVQVSRPSEALAAKRITQNAFSTLFLGLAGVALLVGGIGVANTMVISVLERRREIGLRRALGANRRQIRGQFLTESIVLCAIGGAMGAVLGVLGVIGYAESQHWPVVIPASAVLTGLGASIAVGVLAGVYPAVRASLLTPTEALAAD
ncbi:ABC transporter permease [Kribbella sandramycini]|uniref:ABC transporter permease n=1 Tax=Kribbella sandramycini TaxID=60450 RepID=A0A7Y4L7H0_9ACTN|nr:ABC transporter permease [Kribbella sandramycini]MBB6570262.1 putative ABC transport system permease protein [Kribbella sandramycini]NOL45820.1 ABC transporter permease [Kribbella sandramycini]